ncbi:MAG TPA: hypothetical protein VGF48_14320 [Thermoanaerobaculia bacterium]|jgi:hypothetical protein
MRHLFASFFLSVLLTTACASKSSQTAEPDTGDPLSTEGWTIVRIQEDGQHSGIAAAMGRGDESLTVVNDGTNLVITHCHDLRCAERQHTVVADSVVRRAGFDLWWAGGATLPLIAYEPRIRPGLTLLDCLDRSCVKYRQVELPAFAWESWSAVRQQSDVVIAMTAAPKVSRTPEATELVLLRCPDGDCSRALTETIARDARHAGFSIVSNGSALAVAYVDGGGEAKLFRCDGTARCRHMRLPRCVGALELSAALSRDGELWLGVLEQRTDVSSRVRLLRCRAERCTTVQLVDVEPADALHISIPADGRISGALRHSAANVLSTIRCTDIACRRIDVRKAGDAASRSPSEKMARSTVSVSRAVK